MPRHPAQRPPRPAALIRRGSALKAQPGHAPAPRFRRVWKEVHGQRVLVKVYPPVWVPPET